MLVWTKIEKQCSAHTIYREKKIKGIQRNISYENINCRSFIKSKDKDIVKYFPVWLRNRFLSAGLEPVLSQTEKACIASNYRQFLRISK